MHTKHTHETGQILIIFAVALTALLGFAALAIDGGMIFADRRQSQSVADSASLAGAGAAASVLETGKISWTKFTCNTADPNYVKVYDSINAAYAAAFDRAAKNHVTDLDNDISDGHGVDVTCFSDPVNYEKHLLVTTKVTSTVSTSFAHLFYKDQIKNTVTAQTMLHPRAEFGYGNAIIALRESCGPNTDGMVFDGTIDIKINGGGVYSNSCLLGSGHVSVNAGTGSINYFTTYTNNGGAVLDPGPTKTTVRMPKLNIPPPQCGTGALTSISGGGTYGPGNYSQIKLPNGSTDILQLKPGLYCVYGDVDIRGGEIDSVRETDALGNPIDGSTGITIYLLKDAAGHNTNLNINGNATAHLNASTLEKPYGHPPAIKGILIYMANGNAGNVALVGTSASSFTGTVYAPDGDIDAGGTTGINPTLNTQLIGKDVRVHGSGQINIVYDASSAYTTNPSGDLTK